MLTIIRVSWKNDDARRVRGRVAANLQFIFKKKSVKQNKTRVCLYLAFQYCWDFAFGI